MSDGLIERLKAVKTIPNKTFEVYYPVMLLHSEIKEILSALKTVRGIEGLAKDSVVEIWGSTATDKRYTVNKTTKQTLSLAVDAAVGANEIGGN